MAELDLSPAPDELYYGSTRVDRLYVGSTLVYQRTAGGYTFTNTEAETYVNAMTVEPNDTRKGHIDTLVGGLKTDGLWSKIGLLYLLAAHDAQAGRLNAKTPASHALVNDGSAPTFTTDRGFTTDNTNMLDTGLAENALPSVSETDCHMAVYVNDNTSSGTTEPVMGATNFFRIGSKSGTNATPRLFTNVNATVSSGGDRTGFQAGTRTGTTAVGFHQSTVGSNTDISSDTRTPSSSNNLKILGRAVNPCAAGDRVAFACVGEYLTNAEVANLKSRIETYLTAIGAD
ncbi:MAG: hypothetical protein MJH10_16110 [Epibacterium sp.]|nr:hypothetical protein [Epibacterium sp.]NQX75039.1 hypothetical protein [Epibacterium sp.]